MNDQKHLCNPQLIESSLADSLCAEEQERFETHLEVCAACREALESRAAAPADWQHVREYLSSQEIRHQTGRSANRGSVEATSIRMTGAGLEADESGEAAANQREAVDGVLSALAPTDDPHMLGRLGPYEIAGVVGRGGMGVVLKALDPALNRFVAIKVLAPQLATSGAARQRFAREARAAASVVHENVVAIHAVADRGALPYFVMPYLRGASLQKRLNLDGPLGTAEILRVSIQIAAGLSAAHAQGLVHRDIKPANILLEDGVERLKITDFGLARAADDASLTRTGVIAGTPQFMSPEQARGELIDSRSDLFSLGSVMYAMCTARPPFRSETSYGTLQRICDAQPRPIREINAAIPLWLVAVIRRMHAKSPDDRFQTAHEIAQLLEQCLAHIRQPDAAPLPAVVERLAASEMELTTNRRADWHSDRSPSQRRAVFDFLSRRKRWILAGMAVVVLICGIGLSGRLWFGARPASAPALDEREQPAATTVEIVGATDTRRTERSVDTQPPETMD
ncbi:MAG TPA: protein kinase, partial [Pirellulales bacterium]